MVALRHWSNSDSYIIAKILSLISCNVDVVTISQLHHSHSYLLASAPSPCGLGSVVEYNKPISFCGRVS